MVYSCGMTKQERFGINDLAEQSGVSTRTIRYYVTKDLLPPAHGAGRGAYYDRSHLNRIHLIHRMQLEHKSLAHIGRYLGKMNDADVELGLTERNIDRFLLELDRRIMREDARRPTEQLVQPTEEANEAGRIDFFELIGMSPEAAAIARAKLAEDREETIPDIDINDINDINEDQVKDSGCDATSADSQEVEPSFWTRDTKRVRDLIPANEEQAKKSSKTPRLRRATWQRYIISDDIEIHVRRPLSAPVNKKLEKLLQNAVSLFF